MSFDMSTARKGECPKPHLVQYENQPRNETKPFNLQEQVLPHRTDDTGLSGEHLSHLTAKLLAAKEGHHPTSKGEADRAQGSDLHSMSSGSHDQHPGPEGGHQPHTHQSIHPIPHENAFTHLSQQHGFNEQPHAPGIPPWMQGTPYDYAAALQAGWYPPPMAPYLPFYQPTMHPPYRGSYAEGAPQASYNVQQAAVNHGPDYSGGIRGGYRTTHHVHVPTSLGQTLPDVTATSTSLDVPDAPCLGSLSSPGLLQVKVQTNSRSRG
ncbi:hypothetical protein SCLCIDRAFT_26254 [Scleroderma citrinum Foug A]|uniref:Uncharacterized protein n=1 Tax=Scleroderma citrinum Foug A TaxID=1036808 RepID=A0A0C3DJM7_9AGAM|nr:hypothetical protein SCLCIDRAFT_26254 [Scleroderma citrinum Foug A]